MVGNQFSNLVKLLDVGLEYVTSAHHNCFYFMVLKVHSFTYRYEYRQWWFYSFYYTHIFKPLGAAGVHSGLKITRVISNLQKNPQMLTY